MSQTPRPSGKPCCPNHGCPLVDLPFPLPSKGIGTCPVSGCQFEFEIEVDEEETKMNVNGEKIKSSKWKLEGNEIN